MARGFYALNFFSPAFVDQLKRGRKTATIRLGDKSRKYERGQLRLDHGRPPAQPAGEDLHRGDRRRRGQAGARALAARHRARQPRVPPGRGDARLHAPDLRPRDRSRGARSPWSASRRSSRRRTARLRQRRDPVAATSRAAMPVEYRFLTTWLLESPREPVWDAIYDQRRGRRGGGGSRTWSSSSPATRPASARTRALHLALEAPLRPRLRGADARGREAAPDRGRRLRRARRHRPLAPVRAGRGDRGRSTSGTCARRSAWMNALAPLLRAVVRVEPRLGDAQRRHRDRRAARRAALLASD